MGKDAKIFAVQGMTPLVISHVLPRAIASVCPAGQATTAPDVSVQMPLNISLSDGYPLVNLFSSNRLPILKYLSEP